MIHGADSEVSDLIRSYDAGWVVPSDDPEPWREALAHATDPVVLEAKQRGALRLSAERFAPAAALADAAAALGGS